MRPGQPRLGPISLRVQQRAAQPGQRWCLDEQPQPRAQPALAQFQFLQAAARHACKAATEASARFNPRFNFRRRRRWGSRRGGRRRRPALRLLKS
jgi:hypothetical protein